MTPDTPPSTTDSPQRNAASAPLRAAGVTLVAAALAFVVGLAFHPPPSPNPAEFMAMIAADPTRWVAAHWLSAISLAGFAIAGLIVLTARSSLTDHWSTVVAWAVFVVSAVWITNAALSEATAVTAASVAGDSAAFEVWQAYAGAYSVAFIGFGGAVAIIAAQHARDPHGLTPRWAAGLGAVVSGVAVVAYLLNFAVGVALAGPVWLGTTFVMSLWLLWLGIALTRGGARSQAMDAEVEAGAHDPTT